MDQPKVEKKQHGVGDRLHVVRCNHCRQPVLYEHRSLHAFECRQRRNKQKLAAFNLTKDKPLYAVAVSRFKGGEWRAPETLYAHAETPSEAKRIVLSGETDKLHIIEVGLAVGWFEHEKTGIITA